MNKDVLGSVELEYLKLNWNFYGPGLMSGRCAATGTCDNRPIFDSKKMKYQGKHKIYFSADPKSAKEIRLQYGLLC